LRKFLAAASLTLVTLLVTCTAALAMELTSPDITTGAKLSLAQVHTRCSGQNRSPALHWSSAPAGTRSFALTLFDPDAGGGAGFWHWLVFDIPGSAGGLPEGTSAGNGLPPGAVQASNDFGETGYGGACPPPGSGVHHYEFTLYALGTPRLSFGTDAKGTDISVWLKSHALATASLVGTYQR
jgi:Raf kinase inhibitor-like YbhB/YbcL family protein